MGVNTVYHKALCNIRHKFLIGFAKFICVIYHSIHPQIGINLQEGENRIKSCKNFMLIKILFPSQCFVINFLPISLWIASSHCEIKFMDIISLCCSSKVMVSCWIYCHTNHANGYWLQPTKQRTTAFWECKEFLQISGLKLLQTFWEVMIMFMQSFCRNIEDLARWKRQQYTPCMFSYELISPSMSTKLKCIFNYLNVHYFTFQEKMHPYCRKWGSRWESQFQNKY